MNANIQAGIYSVSYSLSKEQIQIYNRIWFIILPCIGLLIMGIIEQSKLFYKWIEKILLFLKDYVSTKKNLSKNMELSMHFKQLMDRLQLIFPEIWETLKVFETSYNISMKMKKIIWWVVLQLMKLKTNLRLIDLL